MELRQLEYFVATAEERNFTRAAARVHVAQSGLSATIKSLERELGAPLFLRTTRHVELTPAGRALLGEARHTLASARAAVDAVADVEGVRRGSLTIGMMQTGRLHDLAGLLARFRTGYPDIGLRLRQASSSELTDLVLDGSVDVAFATAPEQPRSGITTKELLRSRLVIVCALGDPLAARGPIALDQLCVRELVGFPSGWGVRTIADGAFRAAGLEPKTDLEVNDTGTLLDLVEAGIGVTLIPLAMAEDRPTLRTLEIADDEWFWIIAAETLAPRPPNPAARALWQLLD